MVRYVRQADCRMCRVHISRTFPALQRSKQLNNAAPRARAQSRFGFQAYGDLVKQATDLTAINGSALMPPAAVGGNAFGLDAETILKVLRLRTQVHLRTNAPLPRERDPRRSASARLSARRPHRWARTVCVCCVRCPTVARMRTDRCTHAVSRMLTMRTGGQPPVWQPKPTQAAGSGADVAAGSGADAACCRGQTLLGPALRRL
jgi:hypothetical protein